MCDDLRDGAGFRAQRPLTPFNAEVAQILTGGAEPRIEAAASSDALRLIFIDLIRKVVDLAKFPLDTLQVD